MRLRKTIAAICQVVNDMGFPNQHNGQSRRDWLDEDIYDVLSTRHNWEIDLLNDVTCDLSTSFEHDSYIMNEDAEKVIIPILEGYLR